MSRPNCLNSSHPKMTPSPMFPPSTSEATDTPPPALYNDTPCQIDSALCVSTQRSLTILHQQCVQRKNFKGTTTTTTTIAQDTYMDCGDCVIRLARECARKWHVTTVQSSSPLLVWDSPEQNWNTERTDQNAYASYKISASVHCIANGIADDCVSAWIARVSHILQPIPLTRKAAELHCVARLAATEVLADKCIRVITARSSC